MRMNNLILALDCSLRWTNVAVLGDGDGLASEQLDIARRQAAELPLIVERVLEKAGRRLADIGLIAFTNGPGYFTGICVGASYAAALAYGLGVKVVPVSALSMLAFSHVRRSQPVLAVVYAGRGCVYAASFGCGDDLPEGEYRGETLEAWLNVHDKIIAVSDEPQRACDATSLKYPVLQVLPDASVVAQIAWRERESAVSPMNLRIAYHRLPQGCEKITT